MCTLRERERERERERNREIEREREREKERLGKGHDVRDMTDSSSVLHRAVSF